MKIRAKIMKLSLLLVGILPGMSTAYSQITPGDTIHAAKYVIDLQEVDMSAQTIRANTTVTLVPLVDNLDVFQLQLM